MSDENQFDSLDDLSEDEEGDLEENTDLTRLEDLSEFLHEEDPSVDEFLDSAEAKRKSEDNSPPDLPPPVDLNELDDEESSSDDFSAEETSFDEGDDFDSQEDSFESSETFDTDEDSEGPDNEEGDAFSSDFDEATEPNISLEDSSDDLTSDSFDEESDSFSVDEEDSEESNDDFQLEETSFESTEDSIETDSSEDSESNDFESSSFEQEEDENNEDAFAGLAPLPDEDDDQQDEQDNEESSFNESSETEDNWQVTEEVSENTESFSSEIGEEMGSFQEAEESTPQPPPTTTEVQPRENFQDIRDFGNNISYGTVSVGGNPPFGLIIRGIRFEEDAEDILILLREHGLVSEENEATMKQAMENGSLLISQISEYSAIYLAHKMRRFDVQIEVGLSEEIHPSKSYENDSRGLVSKYNLRQNISEAMSLENHEVEVDSIVMSTTPTLDGFHIHHYLEVVTSHTMVEEEELRALHAANELEDEMNYDQEIKEVLSSDEAEEILKDQKYLSQYSLGLGEIYNELVIELRNQAYKVEANAVVGINFQITPLIGDSDGVSVGMYKITCTGNAVWIVEMINKEPLNQCAEHYPVITIGAGIVGAGVFRDLSLHGIPSLLIDKNDFSSQTSQSSSKMLHGGIRYLENFDFKLVWEALHEKNLWIKLTPHLAYENSFHIPVYKDDLRALWMIRSGIFLYDLLSGFENSSHPSKNAHQTLGSYPQLREQGLKGSGVYSDAVVDDAKLTLEVIYDGLKQKGSRALNHVSLIAMEELSQGFKLTLKDEITGKNKKVSADQVVFATGPFTDNLLNQLKAFPWQNKLLPSKGSHIWLKREALELSGPMVLTPKDGRVIFVIPQNDRILVGTTEVQPSGSFFDITPSQQEIQYLLANLKEYFPKAKVSEDHIMGSFAGIRPLVMEDGQNRGKTARDHKIFRPHSRVRVILGGKYTTFRVMAADVVKDICHFHSIPYNEDYSLMPLKQRSVVLPFEETPLSLELCQQALNQELPRTIKDLLVRRMGLINPQVLHKEFVGEIKNQFSNVLIDDLNYQR